MEQEKTRTQVDGTFEELTGVLSVLSGVKLTGYEIHMGASRRTDHAEIDMDTVMMDLGRSEKPEMLQEKRYEYLCHITDQAENQKADGICAGNVYGTYVHGVFDADGAILKVGNKYYRAISGSEPDSYLLEQIKLYKSDVELVEVKK